MARAIWNGAIVAESDQTVVVEGNHYFPPDSVKRKFLAKSDTHTTCYWKGVASYYHISVDGEINRNAAWVYPSTSQAAKQIEGYIAFWRGVHVEH
ncbi:MAG TPA: DUF427 domain-containing protein [Anaerolineales bacterium]|jgi:uncharacterized protein (DUF427 family)